ncbi:MAG TPA: phytanoyl-CoA dioxygenase family protein [Caldilineaceae bacterium]|nr:phytanoyl-CoA dioxygenase family protein [Caldilineaceae bacterium]
MLTPEQISHYEIFGFVFLPQAFSADEVATITEAFDTLLDQDRQGQPFPGVKRQSFYGIAEHSPALMKLLVDDRIYAAVEQLLGPDFVWLNSEGNLYVGDTNWHPDGTRLLYPPIKVSLYLDSLHKESGCMRVIPGSHRLPFHESLKAIHQLGIPGSAVPAYPCESRPGDVLFMNMNLWHSSFGGAVGRRHLAVNFAPAPITPEQQEIFLQNYRGVIGQIQRLQTTQSNRATTDEFLYSDHPRLQRLAAKWLEYGLR